VARAARHRRRHERKALSRTVSFAYLPENWTWRDGPIEHGRAVVVDIDGVLSDASTRQHYIESPRADWRAFFDACGEDPVIDEVKRLLDLLDPTLQVILLTARPHRVHHLTEAWIRHYEIRWDLLIMRSWGDYDWARDFKQASVHDLRRSGFDLQLAFEDDPGNVEMFRREGIPTLYVHSGYYE
jgi:hypothetical protein